jgi:hypothetical protein
MGAAVGVERCTDDASLGDEGDEGKERAIIAGAARVAAAVGVERCNLGKQANLGDEDDEGKGPSSLGPRVGAAVSAERCTLGMEILATRVTKAKSHRRWSRACGSGGGCREMHR